MASALADKLEAFFTKYPRRTYPKGEHLIFADEPPEHIFYIVSGKVRQYSISYRGDEVIVNIFKPPAFFPMSYAINRSENRFFFRTEEASVLHVVPPDDALAFLRENPDVTLDLLSRVYRGTDGLLDRMVQLMSGSAKSRVMHELVIETRRFGKPDAAGKYALAINEFDLASRCGLSRETVSREMQKLKEAGVVSLHGKALMIDDYDALQNLLG